MAITISNEDDLFRVLDGIKNGRDVLASEIKFEGWPKYEIVIRGEDFKGGVPTRIMPALLSLQKSIDAAYSQSIYGETRRLKKEERHETEIIVYLENGSTRFKADLGEILNNFLKTAVKKMSGKQTVITILGVAAIAGCTWSFNAWLDQQSFNKKSEFDAKLSEQETARYQMIKDLASEVVSLEKSKEAIEGTNKKIIDKLDDSDLLILDNNVHITGATGKKIVKMKPDEPIEIRLDGEYRILSVQSGAVRSGFKATIENIESSEQLIIDIPEGTLDASQLDSLQKGEWAKTPLYMRINGTKRNDKIIKATLTHAGLDDDAD